MPVFSIPLSGLTAASTALSAISNNLANLNTVGYKGTTAVFRDLFYQTVGSTQAGNPIQVGAGTGVGSLSTIFTDGNIQSTGVPTDVAISGDGFFVVQDGTGYQYSRAGNFQINPQGFLSSEDGQPILGYPAQNGVVNTGAALGELQLGKGQVSQPSATTQVQMHSNLNADALTTDPSFTTPLTVIDSLGASHVLKFQFSKTGQGAWSYNVTIPAADVGQTGADVVITSGNLGFNTSGQLTSPAGDVTGITIPGFANGAAPLPFTWTLYDTPNLGPASGMLTQRAAPSNNSSIGQNGFGGGTLTDFAIGSDGTIQGTFSNGKTTVLGQVALATFPNVQGLMRDGHNNYSATLASGASVIGSPGSGGRGTLTGGALEGSNVDMAREFADMLTAQRGYQANARAITTFDQITQETINLVHG